MSDCYIQGLFAKAAKTFSAEVAISDGTRNMSYRQLDERSNGLANDLIRRGLGNGAIVGLLSKDSFEVITSIIGILKAGSIFVPLDPWLPIKRLETLSQAVAPSCFLIDPELAEVAGQLDKSSDPESRIIRLGAEEHRSCSETAILNGRVSYDNVAAPIIDYDGNQKCYIYFTSGSTGAPKAILGRLKGIDHFIRWEIETLKLEKGVRSSRLLPFTFDGSLRDIFVPLCAGGTICLPPNEEVVRDAAQFAAWIDDQSINLIHCIPSLFRALINDRPTPDRFRHLKYILMAGEPLLPLDVDRWMSIFGERIQLINLYGTSETTMAKFYYFVQEADRRRRSIPIGKPMEGAKALLLDEKGNVSPIGTVGEIYLRTPYRSHGYYRQPELTQAVFIQNPFNNDPSDVIYKTGDLARILEDGNFEYLGRKDHQVKIRGVRVELSEIENLLQQHESISEAAVVDFEDLRNERYLCAYLVSDGLIATGEIKDYLAQRLPEQMIPTHFIALDELPRTISGKIDRRSLPPPRREDAYNERSFLAPRDSVEELVAGIWADVLHLDKVGVHDDFFQLGGHSLRATQTLSRMNSAFNTTIPLRFLLEKPTIAEISEMIRNQINADGLIRSAPIPLVVGPLRRTLSYGQQRLWFLEQLEPGSSQYNLNAAVRLEGSLDIDALEEAISETVRRHEALRTVFRLENGQPTQTVLEPSRTKLKLTDLGMLPAPERERQAREVAAAEAGRPFDLGQGPLLRASLLRMGEQEHILLFVLHHIACDGWSIGVLVRELSMLYAAYVEGRPSPLEEPPIQYADYAVWQREYLQGEVWEQQLAYWKKRLGGELPQLELPTDRPRPATQSHRGAARRFVISEKLTSQLRLLGRREGATLYMTLLAAFQCLLYRYSGQTDILVGTPNANRSRVELEGLIGFFMNTLVIRGDLGGDPTFLEILSRVRERTLEAYAHQDLPFEALVAELQPERTANYNPLFRVWFAWLDEQLSELQLSNLAVRGFEVEDHSSRFDIVLSFTNTDCQLNGSFRYNTDIFDEDTIEEMIERFLSLLGSITLDSGLKLLDIPLE